MDGSPAFQYSAWPMPPHLALERLDPTRRTPVAIYNALLWAAHLHPHVAFHLQSLAYPHPTPPTEGSPHVPTAAPCYPPAGPAPVACTTQGPPPVPIAPSSRPALQPMPQPPAPVAPADSAIRAKAKAKAKAPTPARPPPAKVFTTQVRRARAALASRRGPFAVQGQLEVMTAALANEVAPAASWATRRNAVSAVRDIVFEIVLTEGPIGRQLKNAGSYDFEVNFKKAIKELSEDERRRLGTEEGGQWLEVLKTLKSEARKYCVMQETLDEIIGLVSPRPASPDVP